MQIMRVQSKKSTISKNSFHAKMVVTWCSVTRWMQMFDGDEG